MARCVICRDDPEVDDIQMTIAPGRVICAGCWHRTVSPDQRLSPQVRREIIAAAGSEGK